MSSTVIRPGQRADRDALADLGAGTFTDVFGHLYSRENLQAFLEENHTPAVYEALLADDSCRVLVSEALDGTLAGYAVAGPCGLPVDDPQDGDLEIKRLYVDARWRNAGMGRQLLDPLLTWCTGRQPTGLYLSVYAENTGAQRFYRRYGFDKVKEYEFLVGEHRDPEFIFARRQAVS